MRVWWMAGVAAMSWTMVFGAGCTMDIPLYERKEVVRAIWDPSSSTLPTPTDLVFDKETRRLDLPLDDETLTPAEREFRMYLNTLDGYPLQTSIEIPVSDAVDPASLLGAVVVLDTHTGSSVPVTTTFDAQSNTIKVSPIGPVDEEQIWQPGRTYMYGLWGYEGGVRGLFGNPVIADAAFYLVRSELPLAEHATAMPGDTREERQEAAETLAEVQAEYAPLFHWMEQRGIRRDEVAVAGSFTTSNQASIWFDPSSKRIPFPNDLLIDPDTGKVEVPVSDDDREDIRHIKEGLALYEGFSTTSAIIVRATERIDPYALYQPNFIRVFRKNRDGSFTEEHDLERGLLDDGFSAWVRPRLAFRANTEYAYIVTKQLRTADGRSVEAQPLAAMMRHKAPLLENGQSQIGNLSDEDARRIEPLRERVNHLLSGLEKQGLSRDELAAAVPFSTLSAIEPFMEKRAQLYHEQVPTRLTNVTSLKPSGALTVLMSHVKTIIRGKMTVLDHLDPMTHAIEPGSEPQLREVDFVMTIPNTVDDSKTIPVVLFGHGLMTSRELLYLAANSLAEHGYAAFSLDLPMHGERAICEADTDCAGSATCNAYGKCIEADGSDGTLARMEIPYLVPFLRNTQFQEMMSYPVNSGAAFIDFDNILGTRDHFFQALLDLCQALRVIRSQDLTNAVIDHAGRTLQADDVVYLGMSLGGILGAKLAAIEPTLETFVLNVPGADLIALIENSGVFREQLMRMLPERDMEFQSDEYFSFTNAVRWILDPIDPVNFAQHAVLEPITYVDPVDGMTKKSPVKRVMLQMVEGDTVVPNIGTEILSERMGVPITKYPTTIGNHGFLFDPVSSTSRQARQDMVEFLNAR